MQALARVERVAFPGAGLGVVIDDLHNTFFADVVDGIHSEAAEHGYRLLLNTAWRRDDDEERAVESFLEYRVDAVILAGTRLQAPILTELAKDFGVPRGEQLLLDLDLTQAELATLVGSTRQTVNASLRDLEEDGLIQRDGRRLIVVKPQELARQAPDRSESG